MFYIKKFIALGIIIFSSNLLLADTIYKGSEVTIAGGHGVQLFHKVTGKPINGTVKEYHENGKLKKINPCLNGYTNGTEKEYYESGALYSEREAILGIDSGIHKYYYENGNTSQESKYKVEKKDGKVVSSERTALTYFYDTGEIEGIWTYGKGGWGEDGIQRMYYKSGAVKKEALYREGSVASPVKHFSEKGDLIKETKYW